MLFSAHFQRTVSPGFPLVGCLWFKTAFDTFHRIVQLSRQWDQCLGEIFAKLSIQLNYSSLIISFMSASMFQNVNSSRHLASSHRISFLLINLNIIPRHWCSVVWFTEQCIQTLDNVILLIYSQFPCVFTYLQFAHRKFHRNGEAKNCLQRLTPIDRWYGERWKQKNRRWMDSRQIYD